MNYFPYLNKRIYFIFQRGSYIDHTIPRLRTNVTLILNKTVLKSMTYSLSGESIICLFDMCLKHRSVVFSLFINSTGIYQIQVCNKSILTHKKIWRAKKKVLLWLISANSNPKIKTKKPYKSNKLFYLHII